MSRHREIFASEYTGIAASASGTVRLSNSVIEAEAYPSTVREACAGTIISRGYNLIRGITSNCAFTGDLTGNRFGVDPRLGALQNNGGPMLTHKLLAGSPARNAANPARPGSAEPACGPQDQRGLSRTRDAHCDIGAVEMS